MRLPSLATCASLWATLGSALIIFIAIALCKRLLSPFEFGIFAFFLTISAVMVALDGGLGYAVNREMAALNSSESDFVRIHSCLLKLFLFCLLLSLVLFISLLNLLPWIVEQWLQIEAGQLNQTLSWLPLISCISVLQIPIWFSTQAMLGLNLHTYCHFTNVIFVAIRFFGGAALISHNSPDNLLCLLNWHLGISLLHLIIISTFLWNQLPKIKCVKVMVYYGFASRILYLKCLLFP
ncbi:MAG: hypothetical protein HC765_03225 [Brachymonas sp.]|nr:hypothetical protein [Brachymonas sp.]